MNGSDLIPYVEQIFDTDRIESLKGKTVTFGCNVLSLVRASDAPAQLFFSSNGAIVQTIDFLTAGIHSFTFEVPSDSYSLSVGLYVNAANGTAGTVMELTCLKLELGSVCTIANDVAPDYGDTLARCQRYFINLTAPTDAYCTGNGVTVNGVCYWEISLPCEMRAVPSFANTSNLVAEVYGNGEMQNATNVEIVTIASNQVRGRMNCSLSNSTNYVQFKNCMLTAEL